MWNRPIHVIASTDFYELVWSEPVEKIAHRYKLSGNGLAKICKKHRIPLPPRGYWAKIHHGHKPRRITLRAAASQDLETVRITEGMGPRPVAAPKPELEVPIVAALEKVMLPENHIVLADSSARQHRLVLEMARDIDRGWDGKRKIPSPIEIRRRQILSAFIRGVEKTRGTAGTLGQSGYFDATLYGSTFRVSCAEPERRDRVALNAKEMRERAAWETRDWKTVSSPSGLLRLRIQLNDSKYKDFSDSVESQLEDRLTDIMVYLLRHTITVAERDRRREAEKLAKAEAERVRYEEDLRRWQFEEQQRRERERAAALLESVARSRKAEDLRSYVAAAGDAADEEWTSWALGVANALDPLRRK